MVDISLTYLIEEAAQNFFLLSLALAKISQMNLVDNSLSSVISSIKYMCNWSDSCCEMNENDKLIQTARW